VNPIEPTIQSLKIAEGSARPLAVVIEADPPAAAPLVAFLGRNHFSPVHCSTLSGAKDALLAAEAACQSGAPFGVVLIDSDFAPNADQVVDLLRDHPWIAVVVVASYGNVQSAVSLLRAGAVDYLVRPFVDAELSATLDRAVQHSMVRSENTALRGRLSVANRSRRLIGQDPRMHKVYELVDAVASGRSTVLMTGESGTGKSLIAREIHDRSPRRTAPFIELSCGSIPETLLESELFGHVKGAFTGAHADKVGRFLAADKGTIFLDEINSASPGMQLKLLRVLQERRFEPVGSSQTIEVDVRVLLATNQPLEPLVQAGTFRQDLYYRINVIGIDVPPLRDRSADVPVLARAFLTRQASEIGRQFVGFTDAAMHALVAYVFPGNVRELQNVIERAAVVCRGSTISELDLPSHVLAAKAATGSIADGPATDEGAGWARQTLEDALRQPEREILLRALRANDWSRQKTAADLGINRTTLYKKMRSLGLDAPERLAG